jgi:NhaP-type Na+/H+ or K+/H+ antiporter
MRAGIYQGLFICTILGEFVVFILVGLACGTQMISNNLQFPDVIGAAVEAFMVRMMPVDTCDVARSISV